MTLLHDIWLHEATAWRVGQYLFMPDHLHFFAAPSSATPVSIERWTQFWKDRFSRSFGRSEWRWQRGLFHHRIRSAEEWAEKASYIRNNPLAKGLVESPDLWPWQGAVHSLTW